MIETYVEVSQGENKVSFRSELEADTVRVGVETSDDYTETVVPRETLIQAFLRFKEATR